MSFLKYEVLKLEYSLFNSSIKGLHLFFEINLLATAEDKSSEEFEKASASALKNAKSIVSLDRSFAPLLQALKEGRTLHHDVYGHHGAGKVLLRSAPSGTGIIAGGPMRAVVRGTSTTLQ